MLNIELFNNSLNTTDENRFLLWKDYRSNVDSILSKTINKTGKELVIVIGAGRCEDFSLELLVKNFNEVVLTDIDLSSVKESVDRCNLSVDDRKKIKLERIEYTGFEKNQFFNDFEERVINCKSHECLETLLVNRLKGVEAYKFLKSYTNKASLVLVTPIYTQLIYQQVMLSCSKLRVSDYPEHLIKFIEGYMQDKLIDVFRNFNSNLIRTMSEYLIVLSDIFQDEAKSKFMKEVRNRISDLDKMEEFYDKYQSDYGFGMGDLGLFLLNELVDEVEKKWLIWPFSKGVDMVVKLAIYKK
ncbi:hypothetical protein RI065_01225 [Mycoplasmatota bacterium zrk1]